MELDPRLRRGDGGEDADDDGSGSESGSSASGTPSPSSPFAADHSSAASREAGGSFSNSTSHQQHLQQQQQHGDGAGPAGLDPSGQDPKKSRACEACRGLKVRCEPDPDDENAPCKRCKKAGRNCVVTMPTRKRQKKTDSRVAELEKKIDALTASLQSRASVSHGGHVSGPVALHPAANQQHNASPEKHGSTGAHGAGDYRSSASDEPSGLGMVWGNGATRHWSMGAGGNQRQPVSPMGQGQRDLSGQDHAPPPMVVAGQKRKIYDRRDAFQDDRSASPATGAPSMFRTQDGDVVDRGILTMDKAAELFARYNDQMLHHLPAVVFPPTMTAAELRRTKPTLFLAIMASAAGEIHGVQRVLQKELMQILATKVIMTGEKHLELVQAVLVAAIWYWPPDHFEELKFYQLIHIAAVMALDIGLGKPANTNHRVLPVFMWRDQPFARSQPPDPCSLESRRTWLAAYFLATNCAMSLHRPILIRWSGFMKECIDVLESSPDAAPTDKLFCHLVQAHRLMEDVNSQFMMDDGGRSAHIGDSRTQFTLRGLEKDLEKYRSAVPSDIMEPVLDISFHIINLYMHELTLQTDIPSQQFQPPFYADHLKSGIVNSETLSAEHINALSACLTGVDGILTTFLSLDVADIRCLPVFNFARVAYSVVILLKMYFSASNAKSELGQVINKEKMRVDYYLESLIQKFRATAADDKSRVAAKFLVVLAMLRSWFTKQAKAESGGSSTGSVNRQGSTAGGTPEGSKTGPSPRHSSVGSAGQSPSQTQQQQPNTANTPLQLLSEVATGRESQSNPARKFFQPGPNMRPITQPFFHDSASSTSNTPPQQSQSLPPNSAFSQVSPEPGNMAAVGFPGMDADLTAAMAPAFPSWMPAPDGSAMGVPGNGAGMTGGFDMSAFGLPSGGGQDAYVDGARMVMNEPWVMDMFQGMSGGSNNFPF